MSQILEYIEHEKMMIKQRIGLVENRIMKLEGQLVDARRKARLLQLDLQKYSKKVIES